MRRVLTTARPMAYGLDQVVEDGVIEWHQLWTIPHELVLVVEAKEVFISRPHSARLTLLEALLLHEGLRLYRPPLWQGREPLLPGAAGPEGRKRLT